MGYLGNGLTITGTQNSKRIVVDATPNQTISTVTGGYLTGQLDVYRNGVKLVDTQDYTASDGASVTFLNAVSEGDELEFVVFENFDVANALSKSGGSLNGDLVVTGIATFNSDVSIGGTLTYEDVTNIDSVGLITARSGVEIGTPGIAATLTAAGGAVFTGVVTASSYRGDGSQLSGVDSSNLVDSGDTNRVAANTSGVVITGIATATEFLHVLGAAGASGKGIEARSNSTQATDTNKAIRVRNNSDTDTFSLSYRGAATFGGDLTIPDYIVHSGDSNTKFGFESADTFTVETGGSERLRVNSSGLVGVNTDSPGRQLTVSGGAAEGVIQITNNTSGGSQANGFELLHFTSGETQLLNRENADMRFDTNNTERLRITAAGLVRVPDSGKLTLGASDDLEIYHDGSASYIHDNGTGDLNICMESGSKLVIQSGTGGNHIAEFNHEGAAELFHNGTMKFETNSSGVVIHEDTDKTIRFTGGIGEIGNVTGFQAVNSAGSAIVDFGMRGTTIRFATGNAERLRIGDSGQIGIGGANYGNSGQVLTSGGSSGAVSWADAAAGVTTHVGTASGIVTSVFLGDATDHKVTVTGFVTFTATQAGTEGESHTIRIVNSGIATVGFSTYFLFPSGAAPVLPTADGAVSLISFTVHDSVGAGCTQLLAGASLNFS